MAKALLGYVGGTDPRLLQEAHHLRVRVRDLEAQIVRLQDENDSLVAALDGRRPLTLRAGRSERAPAYT
ncbi:MAG: hypothetical protein M3Q39_14360 [Actinomycetota bacterium]|jgi:hypothetical protein|nr:hypothetical protein [Actinomycetota bacterium]MDQ3423863.1 hypothetical protein [Actinomycetota bacterium]